MKCPSCEARVGPQDDECKACGYPLHRLCRCGTSYHAGLGKCPSCDRPAVIPASEGRAVPRIKVEERPVGARVHPCPGCGHKVPRGAETCGRCGESLRILCSCGAIYLGSEQRACPACGLLPSREGQHDGRPRRRIVLALLALILLLGGGAAAYQFVWTGEPFLWSKGPNAREIFKQGRALLKSGKPEAALPFLRRATELRPDDADARFWYAIALDDLDRVRDAERELRLAIELDPDLDDALVMLGQIVEDAGSFDEAAALYRRAVENTTKPPEAYRLLADLGERRRNLQMVLDALEGESRVSDSPELMLRLAETRMMRFRMERDPRLKGPVSEALVGCVVRCDGGIGPNPEAVDPMLYLYRAQARVRLELWGLDRGLIGEAETDRQRAPEGTGRDLLDAEIAWASARALDRLGDEPAALQKRGEALATIERVARAMETPREVARIVRLLEMLDARDAALAILTELAEKWPEDAYLVEERARVLIRVGRIRDALTVLLRVRDDGRETAVSAQLILVARMGERDWDGAIREIRRLRDLGQDGSDLLAFEIIARCERILMDPTSRPDELKVLGPLVARLPSPDTLDPLLVGARGRYHIVVGGEDLETGVDLLSTCYRLHPGDYHAGVWLAWGQALLAEQKKSPRLLDDSLATLSRILLAAPEYTWARRLMAQVCYLNELPQRAAELAEEVLAKHPDDRDMRRLLAKACVSAEIDDPERSIAVLEELRKEDPADFEARVWLGHLHLRKGLMSLAASLFEEAKAAAPDEDSRALVTRHVAEIYRQEGHSEHALRTLETATGEGGANRMAYVDLLVALGRPGLALQTLREMMIREPASVPVRRRICEIQFSRRGDPEEVSRILDDLRARDPVPPDVLFLEGMRGLLDSDAQLTEGNEDASLTLARQARDRLANYVERRPEDPAGHYGLGMAMYRAGALEEAAASLLEAQRRGGASPSLSLDLLRIQSRRALTLVRAGEVAAAVELLHGVLRIHPGAVKERKMLAAALLGMRRWKASKSELELILRQTPDDPEAWALLAGLHRQDGRPGEAVTAYEKSVELAPENVLWRFLLAETLLTLGETDRALPHLEEAERLAPAAEVLITMRLGTLVDVGRSDEATRLIDDRIDAHPREALGYELKGRLLMHQAALEDATKALETALRLEPDRVSALELLVGLEADRRHDPEKAIDRATEAAVNRPENAEIQIIVGRAYLLADRILDASTPFQTAVRLEPENAVARILLARVEYQIGRFGRAQLAIEPLLDRAAWWPDLAMLAALLNEGQDRDDVAEKYYRMVLAVQPEHLDALNNLALLLAKQKRPGSRTLIQKALEFQPDDPDLLDTGGYVHAQRGDFAKAREAYERAVFHYEERIADLEVRGRDKESYPPHIRRKLKAQAQAATTSLNQTRSRLDALPE